MMLERITPVLLTYNEAPNIGRTLDRLRWASDIVVVDSQSQDATASILSRYPQCRVFQRPFDDFASQWEFAVTQTQITTEWVLALDADFVLTTELLDELEALDPAADFAGYLVKLIFCIQGKPLRSSILPSLPVLFRRVGASFMPNAHTYKVILSGNVGRLAAHIHHDDRKPLSHWIAMQDRYAMLEARKILGSGWRELDFADRVRRLRVVAPPAIFLYCLMKGALVDGRAGLFYSLQRAFAEVLLSLHLIEHDFRLNQTHQSPAIGNSATSSKSRVPETLDTSI